MFVKLRRRPCPRSCSTRHSENENFDRRDAGSHNEAMSTAQQTDLTLLLKAWSGCDQEALEELVPHVQREKS